MNSSTIGGSYCSDIFEKYLQVLYHPAGSRVRLVGRYYQYQYQYQYQYVVLWYTNPVQVRVDILKVIFFNRPFSDV